MDSRQHWGPFSHSTVFSGSLTFLSWMSVFQVSFSDAGVEAQLSEQGSLSAGKLEGV